MFKRGERRIWNGCGKPSKMNGRNIKNRSCYSVENRRRV